MPALPQQMSASGSMSSSIPGIESSIVRVGAGEPVVPPDESLDARHVLHGYTREELNGMLRPLAQTGHDPVSSMGDDAAIAPLANVAVAVAENMMVETRAEGVMILCKVSGLSWPTVKAIIDMRYKLSGGEPTDLLTCKATYERLRPSTAQQVLRFHRMQQTSHEAPAA